MNTVSEFTGFDSAEMDNWPIFSKKPDNIPLEKWYKAIDNELLSYFYEHYDQVDRSQKWYRKYNCQKDFMILALQSIGFKNCPSVFVDKHGQIYFFKHFGKSGFIIPQYASDGSLGFIGNGDVCVITQKSENLLRVIYYNLDTKDFDFYDIQKSEIEEAHSNGKRIYIKNI